MNTQTIHVYVRQEGLAPNIIGFITNVEKSLKGAEDFRSRLEDLLVDEFDVNVVIPEFDYDILFDGGTLKFVVEDDGAKYPIEITETWVY